MNTQIAPFNPDLKVVTKKVAGMEAAVAAVDVKDAAAVKTMGGNIKMLLDFLEQEKAEWVDPAKAVIEKAKTTYDPFITACKNAKADLTTRATNYVMEQQAIEKKKQDKIAADAQKEKDRIAADLAAGNITEEKAAAKTQKQDEKAVEKISQVKETGQTHGGINVRMISVATITDPSLVPDKYWIIDEVRVRKEALAGVEIPGVTVEKKASGALTGR